MIPIKFTKIDELVKSRIHQVFGVWYEIDDPISDCRPYILRIR
jgi:hypothetical protein